MLKKHLSISFILLFFVILSTLYGCADKNCLDNSLSELRSNIYCGISENFSVKAEYGFKEKNYIDDGKIKDYVYYLTIKLYDISELDSLYKVEFNYNEKTYRENFVADPVSHKLTAKFQIDNFSEKEFSLKILNNSIIEEVCVKSVIPENTLSYSDALVSLQKSQTDLIKLFSDENGNFNGEIRMRILVKDDKPYWFIGLVKDSSSQKALLVDGYSGEILAIREIF